MYSGNLSRGTELATYMKKMGLRTVAEWAAREGNRKGDRLANGQYEDFDEKLWIPVSVESLAWDILPAAMESGSTADMDYQQTKSGPGLPDRSKKERRRRPEERLRTADPW